MKHIIKYIASSFACATALFAMTACDTDVESVTINEPGINNQNAALYESYLANLRAYKQGKHKIAIGWFDNSHLVPNSQGQQMKAVPDSLDYLVLTAPNSINEESLKSMDYLRNVKGTKVLYAINFETIRTDYLAKAKAFAEDKKNEGKTFKGFNDFLVDTVKVSLDICTKHNYDGIIMAYNGKYKNYMSEKEKAEFTSWEHDFIGIAIDWAKRHTDKLLFFQGKPQNVINQEIFSFAKYIIIPCNEEVTAAGVAKNVNFANVEGVPMDKIIPSVMMYSLDATDTKTGYWTNNQYAALGAARWAITEHTNYDIAGLSLVDINADYYHSAFTYPVVRKAISIINPSVKE